MAKKGIGGVDKDGAWDPADTCLVEIPTLLDAIKRERIYAYDLETTGLDPRNDRIEGVAFYVPNEQDPTEPPLRAWYPFTEGTMDHTVDAVVHPLREPMPQRETMEQLRGIWELEDVVAIRHNGIFDDAFLYLSSGLEDNLVVKNIIADSMLADYVADERRKRYGLKIRVEQVFGHRMTTYKEAVGGQATFGFANKKPLGVYACDDTAWTYRLFKWAMDQIHLQDPPRQHKDKWAAPLSDTPGVYSDLEKIFWKIEMKIQRILMEMELTGCFIDWEWLVTVQERVQRQQQEILDEFKESVGWVPNLRSPKQVSDFLYKPPSEGGLGVPTKGVDYNEDLDQYATGDKALKHRKKQFPLVGKLLKYRSLSVINNSFCKKLIGIAQEADDERVHARFRQTGTVIGRLSSADPVNLMNQPRDKDLIRKAFCAHLEDDDDPERSGLCLIDADYAQMELRMAAHLANERNMIEVYTMQGGCHAGEGNGPCDRYTWYECFSCHKKGPPNRLPNGDAACGSCGATGNDIEHQKRCRHVDLHQRTSEDVGVPRNPLAKNANFGLLYRMGAPKFCVYAGLFDDNGDPRLGYGQELIEKWHAAYPGIAVWHERTIQQLLRDNYIAYNIARRRRRLDVEWKINDYRAGTQAIQFRVSGSCQDLIKLAMIRIFDTRNKKVANCRPAEAKLWAQYKFLIQVHDELIFQGPKAIKEELCQLVKDSMEGVATGMRVPFTADARAGRTWDELH